MCGLAEFVMKGRRQAIIAVLLLGLLPLLYFINPVVVALVLLRKGSKEAALIFVWAILPLIGWAAIGDQFPLLLLLGVTALAWILRETESWEFTLLASVVVGVGVEFYLRVQPAMLDSMLAQLQAYMEQSNLQPGMELQELRYFLGSSLSAVCMILASALLILARWMQATLYNPGGFQLEFHALRMEHRVVLVLIGVLLLANFGIVVPSSWVLYLVLPLMFAGIALVHAVVAKQKMSGMWLAVFYALLMLPIVFQLTVMLAIIDSWYDFRTRMNKAA